MAHREPLLSRSVRICAGTAVLALAFGGVAAAQDDPYGIGTPVAASGTGVTAAPGLEAIELASGLTATLVSDKVGLAPDMIALWPDGTAPTHAIICNELEPGESSVDQASVQLVDLATGDVTDMLTGHDQLRPGQDDRLGHGARGRGGG